VGAVGLAVDVLPERVLRAELERRGVEPQLVAEVGEVLGEGVDVGANPLDARVAHAHPVEGEVGEVRRQVRSVKPDGAARRDDTNGQDGAITASVASFSAVTPSVLHVLEKADPRGFAAPPPQPFPPQAPASASPASPNEPVRMRERFSGIGSLQPSG
jgi:hypothetical protein